MNNTNDIYSNLETLFLAIQRIAIILLLLISCLGFVLSGLYGLNKLISKPAEITVDELDEKLIKDDLTQILITKEYKLIEDSTNERAKKIDDNLHPIIQKIKEEIEKQNLIIYDYFNSFENIKLTKEAWVEENSRFIIFDKNKISNILFFKDYKGLSKADIETSLNVELALFSNLTEILKIAIQDNGYLEIVKDEVKKNSLYYETYAFNIKNYLLNYYQKISKQYNQSISDYENELDRNYVEGKEILFIALGFISIFFALTMILLMVKIERNLRTDSKLNK
jgi:hypothetical protein